MQLSKKKAFTLVELLVVVLVLGVLAGIATPKFKRMLETRKTGEAEAMLAAVRTEQEKRCISGKNYQTDLSKLDVMANAGGSKNYEYRSTSSGIIAKAKGKIDYSLQLTSYKEGNICCDGAGCSKLNKNYPECQSLVRDECSANIECTGEQPKSSKTETDGRCTYGYTQSVTCDPDTGAYNASGFVKTSTHCECEGESSGKITNGRCTSDFTRKCNYENGTWYDYQEKNKKCECEGEATGRDQVGRCLQFWERTCNKDTGAWHEKTVVGQVCACEEPTLTQEITKGDYKCQQSRTASCDTLSGVLTYTNWEDVSCTCQKTCEAGYMLDADSCTCEKDEEEEDTSACTEGETKAVPTLTTGRVGRVGRVIPGKVGTACGNCGTRAMIMVCTNGKWKRKIVCQNQGECAAGTTEEVKLCSDGTTTITRTCSSSCTWGSESGTCPTSKPDNPPSGGGSTGGGGGGSNNSGQTCNCSCDRGANGYSCVKCQFGVCDQFTSASRYCGGPCSNGQGAATELTMAGGGTGQFNSEYGMTAYEYGVLNGWNL